MITDYTDDEYRPVQNLYHYTSLESLTKIVESGALRATSVQYLNDASELELGVKLIRSVAKEWIDNPNGNDVEFLKFFYAWLDIYEILYSPSTIFVVCFSEKRDQLSQWRGYTPHGRGVCVKVDAVQIVKSMQAQGWTFQHCRYGERSQRAMAEAILRRMCREAAELKLVKTNHADDFLAICDRARNDVFQIAATIKNGRFSEEQEVRFISPMIELDDRKVGFRVGKSTLIPYVLFAVRDEEQSSPMIIPEVIVGPSPNSVLTVPSLKAYMSQQLMYSRVARGTVVSASDIPYREL